MILQPTDDSLLEVNHCHGKAPGHPCTDGGGTLKLGKTFSGGGTPARGKKAWVPKASEDNPPIAPFASQVGQYPQSGPPGVGYFKGTIGPEHYVNTLLWRDEDGKVRGILNHYPMDFLFQQGQLTSKPKAGLGMPILVEKAGNVNVLVDPAFQRRGIATTLWKEAVKRWNVSAKQQSFTAEGRKFYTALARGK